MPEYLTTAEAAAKLNVTDRRVRALIASGKLPAKLFGSVWMIKATDLKLKRVAKRKPGRPTKS